MAKNLQLSVAARNAALDSFETTVGTTGKLRLLTGTQPANCAASETGTLLGQITMASDWAGNAASGVKTLNNLPLTVNGAADGTLGYFRFVDNAGTTCHKQGTIGLSDADLIVDSLVVMTGLPINITAWSETAPNA